MSSSFLLSSEGGVGKRRKLSMSHDSDDLLGIRGATLFTKPVSEVGISIASCSAATSSIPHKKVIVISSALPERLLKKTAKRKFDALFMDEDEDEPNPQGLLESILSKKRIQFQSYSYKDIPNFFCKEATVTGNDKSGQPETQPQGYDVDVLKAVRQGNVQQLAIYKQQGRSLHCCNNFGESLLHLACRKGLTNVVEFLVNQANVPVKIVDRMGRSPLHDAFWTPEPNYKLIDILLKKCPELLFIKDERNHTPLSYTRRCHWGDWADYLQSREDLFDGIELFKSLSTSNDNSVGQNI